jgi:hypothetical protein
VVENDSGGFLPDFNFDFVSITGFLNLNLDEPEEDFFKLSVIFS